MNVFAPEQLRILEQVAEVLSDNCITLSHLRMLDEYVQLTDAKNESMQQLRREISAQIVLQELHRARPDWSVDQVVAAGDDFLMGKDLLK